MHFIIETFKEGNSASYITGGGQTQRTQDRVTVYETEGCIQAIKRKRKLKLEDSTEDMCRRYQEKRSVKVRSTHEEKTEAHRPNNIPMQHLSRGPIPIKLKDVLFCFGLFCPQCRAFKTS